MQVLLTVNNDQNLPVLVDDEDLEDCRKHKWYLNKKTGYMVSGNKPSISLHTFLVGPAPIGLVTDHENRNKLDNQKHNLRFITNAKNIMNSDTKRGHLKHIYPTRFGTWTVRFTRNYTIVILGNFNSTEKAIEARDLYLKNEGATNVVSS